MPDTNAPVEVFPVSHSTLDAHALGQEVARRYQLPGPVRCGLISRRASDIYRIDCAEGRFALRVMRANYRSAAALTYEAELLAHLDRAGVAVARPVPLPEQGGWHFTLQAPEGPRPIMLSAWLEGSVDDSAPSPARARELGTALAQLHKAAADYDPAAPKRTDMAARIGEKWPALEKAAAADAEMAALYRHAAQALPGLIASTGDLPRGTTHGDLHHGNVMRLADGRLAALDFDECAEDILARDLMAFRWRFDSEDYEAAAWDAFLDGYGAERPLSQAETDALPALTAIRHIYIAAVYAAYIDKIGPVPGWGGGFTELSAKVDKALNRAIAAPQSP